MRLFSTLLTTPPARDFECYGLLSTVGDSMLLFIIDSMQASQTSWKCEPFKEGVPISYRATFDGGQFARLKEGLVPQQMEDKWFIYYEEPYLFLHRSWTGQPVFRVTLKSSPEGAEVTEALWSKEFANAPAAATWDAEYQSRLVDFLLSNLLLGYSKPFPMPANLHEPSRGLLQHHISGTGYPETPIEPKKK